MANPTPTPTPTPTPANHRRPRQTINRSHLDEIANSRKVAVAASDAANATALAGVEFDATLPGQITTLAEAIERKIGALTGGHAAKLEMTAQEKAARDALITVIAPLQTAARRTFSGDQEKLRKAYFIGAHLANDNLLEVLTAAKAMLARVSPGENNAPPQDTLPGIKPPQIQALSDAIAKYGGGITAQGGQRTLNSKALEDIENSVSQLATLRHQVQLAAEQAFPWRSSGVAAIRQTFLLPTDRPLPH